MSTLNNYGIIICTKAKQAQAQALAAMAMGLPSKLGFICFAQPAVNPPSTDPVDATHVFGGMPMTELQMSGIALRAGLLTSQTFPLTFDGVVITQADAEAILGPSATDPIQVNIMSCTQPTYCASGPCLTNALAAGNLQQIIPEV